MSSTNTPVAIDPEHPMFYAELLSRLANRRMLHDEQLCPHIPRIENVDDPLIKHLQSLLDIVADISLCQRNNVSATMVRLAENKGTLETQLFVVFNHNDDQAARCCSQHLEGLFKMLKQVPYNRPANDGSQKVISKDFENNVVDIAKALHNYSFEIFAHRVNKRLSRLTDIRHHIEQDQTYFKPERRSTLLNFFRSLDQIIKAVAKAEATKKLSTDNIRMLVKIYMFWQKHNLLPEDILADTKVTLLDEADEWLKTEHRIDFQLRRWALKIMSFMISANKLFILTQSRRLRKLLDGQFSVRVLDSANKTPYRCDLSSVTVGRALDAVLAGTAYETETYDAARKSFVERLQQEPGYTPGVQRAPIHAELALIIAMVKGEIEDVMPYIGVSKLSCIMCSHYIQAYNEITGQQISTKGSRGKAYPAWFWPSLPDRDGELRQVFIRDIRLQLRRDFQYHAKPLNRVCQNSDSSVGSGFPGLDSDPTMEEILAFTP